jgi:ribosomal protein L20
MNLLKRSGIGMNRKMLAEMAARDPEAFTNLVNAAREKV